MSLFSRGWRCRTPAVMQMEATECGAACLAIILGYYGRFEPLEKLREQCGVTRNGSRASLVLQVGRSYGLRASGYQMPPADLLRLRRPVVVFWNYEHYLVYEGVSRNGDRIYLNDPAEGRRIVGREDFERGYTGVVLAFEPGESFEKSPRRASAFQELSALSKGAGSLVFWMFWGGFLLSVVGLAMPAAFQVFVDDVLIARDDWLMPTLWMFLAALLLGVLIRIATAALSRRLFVYVCVNRFAALLRHMLRLPSGFYSCRNAGDLQHCLSVSGRQAMAYIRSCADVANCVFSAVAYAILMLLYSPWLSLLAFGLTLLACLCLMFMTARHAAADQMLADQRSRLLDSVVSGVDNLESVKVAGQENFIFRAWCAELSSYVQKRTSWGLSASLFRKLPLAMIFFSSVALFCVGAGEVSAGAITQGELFAFIVVAGCFSSFGMSIAAKVGELGPQRAKLARTMEIMDYPEDDIFSREQGKTVSESSDSSLELKNVSFSYGSHHELALSSVNLELKRGCRIAVVGASGSGKTTLAKIASGLLKPKSGQVLLNGRPIEEYSAGEFRKNVAVAEQNARMFSGTVSENLSMFSLAANGRNLKNAMNDACIEEELAGRGNPLRLEVAENGANFSGGQCQRLEIARALARNSPLLILDEATSALDALTEKRIDMAISRRRCGVLIVAHRLSTVREADEIIVLDRGHVAERGRFEELMRRDGLFRRLMTLEEGGDV
ncbi:MAG: ATP-binding cassette domain-containing protein [Succinivibrionaceae bacterium]|nr:ATP-binding cassette domain-containing protein [Succinivibrionaceae bacterium]